MDIHFECHLTRGVSVATAWVPQPVAFKGRRVQIRNGDEYEDGWIIQSVGSEILLGAPYDVR
jgi:hypothetical protein